MIVYGAIEELAIPFRRFLWEDFWMRSSRPLR